MPDRTLVDTDSAQTLTNKTLTAPVIGTISNTGDLALPTSTDTLVGRATTDTLTNKTLTGPVLSGSVTGTYTLAGTPTITSPTITSPTISSGAVILTSGQITFPATQAASANANTFDDYEEGTWTPSVGGNATYTAQNARYTKIGRVVHVSCNLAILVLGTGSASTITGLPFTVGLAQGCVCPVFWLSGAVAPVYAIVFLSSTSAIIYGLTAANASLAFINLMGNGTTIDFQGTYTV